MTRKVGIVSYALEGFYGEAKMSSDELVFTAVSSALRKAGIGRDRIDAVAVSSVDAYDGITISNGLTAPAAGGYEKDATRIQGGGVAAILSAYASILSGSAELAVVAGGDAVKYDDDAISNASYDVHFNRGSGINNIQSYALVATSLLNQGVATEDDFALVAAKNYRAGMTNRHAHITSGYSHKDVASSPMVAWPLRSLEIAPVSKGAAALVLASEKKAKELTKNPLWITGIAGGSNTCAGSWRDLLEMNGLRKAIRTAYDMADVRNPIADIDVFELYTPAAPLELAYYELLGLCEKGKASALLKNGIMSSGREIEVHPYGIKVHDRKIAVNPSGGALCTNPGNCGGVYRATSVMEYLEKHDQARRGVVQDSDINLGFMGETYHVMILEKETR